jgi:hypothetical protein
MAEYPLVFGAACEHLLAPMTRLERSSLDALDVPIEGAFERCGRPMANRRMPLRFPEVVGNFVRRR